MTSGSKRRNPRLCSFEDPDPSTTIDPRVGARHVLLSAAQFLRHSEGIVVVGVRDGERIWQVL